MKKIKTLGSVITLIMILLGCEKITDPAGLRNVGVVPLISDVTGAFINGAPNSSVQFQVSLASGTSVEKAELMVSHQDVYTRVKFADLTSFPATVTMTLGQVIEKLGIAATDINNGDAIYIEVVTTKDGVTTRSNAALSMTVLCVYNVALATGSYHSVSPPSDWNSEGNITITADPVDQYKVYVAGLEKLEGLDEDQGPLVMHINSSSFVVIADKTVIATDAWGEHNIAYGGTGTYNSCSGTYTMSFNISTDESDYGSFLFTFTKNP